MFIHHPSYHTPSICTCCSFVHRINPSTTPVFFSQNRSISPSPDHTRPWFSKGCKFLPMFLGRPPSPTLKRTQPSFVPLIYLFVLPPSTNARVVHMHGYRGRQHHPGRGVPAVLPLPRAPRLQEAGALGVRGSVDGAGPFRGDGAVRVAAVLVSEWARS